MTLTFPFKLRTNVPFQKSRLVRRRIIGARFLRIRKLPRARFVSFKLPFRYSVDDDVCLFSVGEVRTGFSPGDCRSVDRDDAECTAFWSVFAHGPRGGYAAIARARAGVHGLPGAAKGRYRFRSR